MEPAIASLQKAIELDPQNARAHYGLGRAFQKADRSEEASYHFRRATELNEAKLNLETATLHLQNGIQCLRDQRLDDAIALFHQALAAKPDFPEVHFYLGIALAQKGDGQEAVGAFEMALKHRPYNGEIHYNYGIALWQMGKAREAIQELQQAVELNPTDGLSHCALGKVLQQQGDAKRGDQQIRRAQELGACLPSSSTK
jgi:superkiller protein 3